MTDHVVSEGAESVVGGGEEGEIFGSGPHGQAESV